MGRRRLVNWYSIPPGDEEASLNVQSCSADRFLGVDVR